MLVRKSKSFATNDAVWHPEGLLLRGEDEVAGGVADAVDSE